MNYFDKYDWETMLTQHAPVKYDISEYFDILPSYESYADIKKKQDKVDKAKWVSKKDFSAL